jgi:DNA invertase Pin-like site-specific DNA recombinase
MTDSNKNADDKKLAFAYVRVSSKSQASKYGRQTQRDDIDYVSKTHRLELRAWYSDVYSGRTLVREDFIKMTEDLQKRPDVKYVVISRVSRLGRNLREMVNWKYELDKLGVVIYTRDGVIDTSTITGKLSFYTQCMFAEIELDNMTDQLQKGRKKYLDKKRGKVDD